MDATRNCDVFGRPPSDSEVISLTKIPSTYHLSTTNNIERRRS